MTFQSDEILALKTLDGLNAGIPLDFVATDIVGNVRDTEHPTIGAYEFVVAEIAGDGIRISGFVRRCDL